MDTWLLTSNTHFIDNDEVKEDKKKKTGIDFVSRSQSRNELPMRAET